MPRKTPPGPFSRTSDFEERTTRSLEAQDRLLERLELRLESPVLNGGFDDLVKKVDKIENVQEQLGTLASKTNEKIDAIHASIYDPEKGVYVTVKEHGKWIGYASKGLKWFIGLLIAGALTGVGKLLYDFISGHIHFVG